MRCLPATSFFLCLWLAERSRGDSSLRELHTAFSVSLYQTLTETENNSNLVVSPLSVSLSLGLLQLGARTNTLAQLEQTMGFHIGGKTGSLYSVTHLTLLKILHLSSGFITQNNIRNHSTLL